jgi:protease-4
LPFVQAQSGAETVIQELRQAETDKRVAAVLLHVETPGGSALAADLIYREVRRLRERKPVVALMGSQAASGGYYVSACADRIVARPTTLTGSIGVWGGKLVLSELLGKVGVAREAVQRGAMAGLYSEMTPFDGEQRARVQQELGDAYSRFTAIVAERRRLSAEEVNSAARGRLWTGAQALELGLVDELGGYEAALASAKTLAGLDQDLEYAIVRMHTGRHTLLPLPFAMREESWRTSFESLREMARARVWAMAPWMLRIEG